MSCSSQTRAPGDVIMRLLAEVDGTSDDACPSNTRYFAVDTVSRKVACMAPAQGA